MKIINLESTKNTRDLGGMRTTFNKTIKEKKLIRSGSLIHLSNNDIKTLKNNNLKIVIDFRSELEFVNRADVKIDDVTYYNFPALPKKVLANKDQRKDSNLLELVDKEKGGKELLINTYEKLFTTNEGIQAYKNFFKVILNNDDGAILWHCSQGKDRAGMAAFLLEYALGVSLDDCLKDYYYTNIAMQDKIKTLTPIVLKQSNNDRELLPRLKDVFSALPEYINKAIETINLYYGSIDNFIENVLEVDVNLLRQKYLID